jgi:capsular polysaccharide biosynthesis protein
MIVSVHGAGLTNLAFSSKGTIVYELFAESFQPQMYRRISEKLQLHYHSVICPTRDSNPQSANLTISDNDIESIAQAGCLASRQLNAEFR